MLGCVDGSAALGPRRPALSELPRPLSPLPQAGGAHCKAMQRKHRLCSQVTRSPLHEPTHRGALPRQRVRAPRTEATPHLGGRALRRPARGDRQQPARLGAPRPTPPTVGIGGLRKRPAHARVSERSRPPGATRAEIGCLALPGPPRCAPGPAAAPRGSSAQGPRSLLLRLLSLPHRAPGTRCWDRRRSASSPAPAAEEGLCRRAGARTGQGQFAGRRRKGFPGSVLSQAAAMSKPPPKPAKPGQVKVFRALYTFEPRTPDELYFEEGDIIYISDMSDTNWWKGTCKGRTGLIPSNYVAEQAESIDNPLHEAAKRGNLSWLRECLDNQVGVNGLDKAGSTALYWACHGGHKDIVEVLFTQPNVELNQQNKLGDTALHAAAWKGYADIVEMLLAKGARTDLRNNEKKLALDMATNAACASLLKKKQGTGIVCFSLLCSVGTTGSHSLTELEFIKATPF
ncbi:hypothetical protein KIL84_013183 [Mauremys mutica]|uniref:Osteoclast-stimulating factor 1 n=1 Tax=Mauremys mutica TaxID=74926 RepID=A0A9D3WWF5_9SAUR|nr:hypothetical protein KIL84_013183 [Mauremys mutica]